MFLAPRKHDVLAVDLGIDSVRVASAQRHRGTLQIVDLAARPVEDGPANSLPDRHLKVLAELLRGLRLKSCQVIAALPTSMIFTRTVMLDVSPEQSTEERIIWTLQNCLPFNPRDLIFDHWPVGNGPGKSREVIVVATQASIVEQYLRGFENLKLKCVHLDVAPCALGTLMAQTVRHADTPVCTLVLAGGQGYFAVAQAGQILFWRPFDLGATARVPEPTEKHLERVSEEIARCLTHISGSMPLDKLGEMMLFGQWSQVPALGQYLTNHFHIAARSPSPLDTVSPQALSEEARRTDPAAQTHFATAVGLALQFAGGVAHG